MGRATTQWTETERCGHISIHALRGEGDLIRSGVLASLDGISIHALRGEGDGPMSKGDFDRIVFLSTPSVGRATSEWGTFRLGRAYFYPRPPWGGRPNGATAKTTPKTFLSTPSVGRATGSIDEKILAALISIHALRGEGDRTGCRSENCK